MEEATARRWSNKPLLRKARRVWRVCCMTSGVFFLLLCALAFTRVPFDAHRWLGVAGGLCESRPDRIIVLGGSGMPSGPELLRLEYAARAAKTYPSARVLIVHPLDTATVHRMMDELVLRGVGRERIEASTMGTNTREQALGIANALPAVKQEQVAIVTAPASPDLAVLHHRVPVTIAPDAFESWLDCSSDSAEGVMALLTGPQEGEFAWHEVSTRVNHVANDDAQLVLPITDEQREAEAPKPKRPVAKKAAASGGDDGQGSLF